MLNLKVMLHYLYQKELRKIDCLGHKLKMACENCKYWKHQVNKTVMQPFKKFYLLNGLSLIHHYIMQHIIAHISRFTSLIIMRK